MLKTSETLEMPNQIFIFSNVFFGSFIQSEYCGRFVHYEVCMALQ